MRVAVIDLVVVVVVVLVLVLLDHSDQDSGRDTIGTNKGGAAAIAARVPLEGTPMFC